MIKKLDSLLLGYAVVITVLFIVKAGFTLMLLHIAVFMLLMMSLSLLFKSNRNKAAITHNYSFLITYAFLRAFYDVDFLIFLIGMFVVVGIYKYIQKMEAKKQEQ